MAARPFSTLRSCVLSFFLLAEASPLLARDKSPESDFLASLNVATISWTGSAGNGDWLTAGNWSPAIVPRPTDIVNVNANLIIPTGAHFGVLNLLGGNLSGSFTNTGTINWSGGSFSGNITVALGGVLNLGGAAEKVLSGGSIINNGAVNWGGSGPFAMSGGVISNRIGAVFNILSDTNFSLRVGGGFARFDNAGVVRKSGTPGSTVFGSATEFNNYGVVEIQSGTLIWRGGLAQNGTVRVLNGATLAYEGPATFGSASRVDAAEGATVRYQGGSALNFLPGSQFTGAGVNRITGGVTFGGAINLPNFELSTGGSLYGAFTNIGVMNWTGGLFSGELTVALGGVLNLSGSAEKLLTSSSIHNSGVINWGGTGAIVASSGVISNRTGAIFNISGDASFTSRDGGFARFDNSGLVRKTGGAGLALFDGSTEFNNNAVVEIQNGSLAWRGFLAQNGTVRVLAGATLVYEGAATFGAASRVDAAEGAIVRYQAGSLAYAPGSQVTGPGLNRVTGPIILNGAVNFPNFELTASGNLFGAFINTGSMSWSGGTLSGEISIALGGSLNLIGGAEKVFSNGTIINLGVVNWGGSGPIVASGGAITNRAGAVFTILSDTNGSFARFDNAGMVRKVSGAGTTILDTSTEFNNTGVVEIQTGALIWRGGLAQNGTVRVLAGATMIYEGAANFGVNSRVDAAETAIVRYHNGSLNFAPGSQVTGAGANRVIGSVSISGVANLPNFELPAGSSLSGDFMNTGAMIWSGGTLSGTLTIAPGAALNLTGSAEKLLATGAILNSGVVNWGGSGSISALGGAFTNRTGALFNILSDTNASFARFDNAGMVRKTSSSGVTVIDNATEFSNAGVVEVQSGTLIFRGALAQNATMRALPGAALAFECNAIFGPASRVDAAEGATIRYNSGSLTFALGSQVTGIASVNRVAGNVTFNGVLNLPNFELPTGGSLSGVFTNAGTMNWTGGTLSGVLTVAPGATLNLSGAAEKLLSSGTIVNGGTINWSGAGALAAQTGTVSNRAGAQFNILNDATGNFARFDNAGVVRKSASPGTTLLDSSIEFNNTGMIEVQTGTLVWKGGLAHHGTMRAFSGAAVVYEGAATFGPSSRVDAADGATVRYQSGSLNFAPGSQVTGAGVNRVTGPITMGGVLNAPNIELPSGGSVNGTFTNAGTIIWTGGILAGVVTVAPTGLLNITGAADKILSSGAILNGGVVNWGGPGRIEAFGGAMSNRFGAIFNILNNTNASFGRFHNAGVVRKSANVGTAIFNVSSEFYNAGSIDVQTGTLTFNGVFTQGSNGQIDVQINGLPSSALNTRCIVNGTAALAGTLRASFSEKFTPSFGDSFSVFAFQLRSGNFDGVIVPTVRNGLKITSAQFPTELRLLAVSADDNSNFRLGRTAEGHVDLRFIGDVSKTYRVQHTTNFVEWFDLAPVSTSDGLFRMVDANGFNAQRRFYRAITP